MADIFLSRMRNSLGGSRNVVVKRILNELSQDGAFSSMLTAEAKLAAHLNHANIVQVFDLGREKDRLFIAMEYVEGFDLNQMLRRLSKARIALPAEFALLIVREVLRALDYAHRARDADGIPMGLVHRDVSPSNVLISFEGEVKLCDFGIARALGATVSGAREAKMQQTRVAGKSAYMAPEHAAGEDIDARADIFAAGILLWELCAGRRMYKGTDAEMLQLAIAGDVPMLPPRGFDDQPRLQEILSRALAKSAEGRFSTAAQMLEALEQYAVDHGLMASPLRFGAFLTDHFAADIVSMRRERERVAQRLDEEADWSAFGPSSAPPPPSAEAPSVMEVPKAPGLPREALKLMDPRDAKDITGSQLVVTSAPSAFPWWALASGVVLLAIAGILYLVWA